MPATSVVPSLLKARALTKPTSGMVMTCTRPLRRSCTCHKRRNPSLEPKKKQRYKERKRRRKEEMSNVLNIADLAYNSWSRHEGRRQE